MADSQAKKNKLGPKFDETVDSQIEYSRLSEAGRDCRNWMLQISHESRQVWMNDFLPDIAEQGTCEIEQLGNDFCIMRTNENLSSGQLRSTVFPRWVTPLEHQWPTKPSIDGFVEKAAQGLHRKFGSNGEFLEVLSTTPELKRIAIGVKGRLLQLRSQHHTSDASQTVLTALIDKKGLYAGLSRNRLDTGSALPGGLGYLSKSANPVQELPSRAGGKILEVLALLDELSISQKHFPHWLELGAAPGGMTQCLLEWGAQVTAVDLAEMSPGVSQHKGLTHLRINAQELNDASKFDALLSDMNGPYTNAAAVVGKLGSTMRQNALIVFTLKLPDFNAAKNALDLVSHCFKQSSLEIVASRHLFHNRHEFTIIARRL